MKTLFFLFSFLILPFAYSQISDDLFPGGKGTVEDFSQFAFIQPFPGSKAVEREKFSIGRSIFNLIWKEIPTSTEIGVGLGPTFNAVSCAGCHFLNGRGAGLHENVNDTGKSRVDFSLLFRLSQVSAEGISLHPNYGEQLNTFGIDGVPAEGKVNVRFEKITGNYPDGSTYYLRNPIFTFENLAFGDLSKTRISPRQAMQTVGLGLLEAIPEKDLTNLEDPKDSNGDGISGRANRILDKVSGKEKLGRFGWKASQPTLLVQNAAAFHGDIGITSWLFPEQNCPSVQVNCRKSPQGNEPEISKLSLEQVTFFLQISAVPKRRNYEDPAVKLGENLFHKVNCQSCHTPRFVTGNHELEILNQQVIFPYTNLLLHDMGMALADHRPDGKANGREWRTSPLWGIGLIPTVNGHQNLLHDGRARNVEEAILWHGGEAEKSKLAFMSLSKDERSALIDFVNSL